METPVPAPAIPVQTSPSSAAPTPAPRGITPMIRWRAWTEPRVRRWWLLGNMILLIFFAYAGDRLWSRFEETHLIHAGITTAAKIVGAENKIENMPIGPIDPVRLEVDWPNQPAEILTGYLSQHSAVGNTITIHVDPADHNQWTDRSEPTPLLDSLLIGMLILPIIPVLLWIGYLQAARLLGTWQNGSAQPAVVFDRKQSPIAPMSYAIRCSLQNARQKDLFTVYVPRIGYGLDKGNLIWVITPTRKGRPVAALWMAGEQG